jgi:hypothetical protein
VAFRFAGNPLAPEKYAEAIARVDGTVVLLGYDLLHIGGYIREDKGIFDFWRELPGNWKNIRTSALIPDNLFFQRQRCPLPSAGHSRPVRFNMGGCRQKHLWLVG